MHSATDTFYQWPEYQKIIGGYFDQHPWHQAVVVEVAERDDPLVAFLGQTIAVTDEIYQVRDFDVDDAILSVREDVASIRECDGHHEMSDSGADGERVHTIAESGAQVCPHGRRADCGERS